MLITNSSTSANEAAVSVDEALVPSLEEPAISPKKGRPLKKDIVSKTKGHIAKRGRPPGEAAAMAEFKARLINSPKSRKVIDSIINAALDDDHKNQAAAWKILADRILPLNQFEKSASGKGAITINISGLNDATVTASSEPLEGEYTDVEDEEENE